uniref:Uncharacterized protein n=1 Tax=Rhizophora mucronata TaxID=61149 RepID=A0A2P2PGC6_RHIMU
MIDKIEIMFLSTNTSLLSHTPYT